MTASGYPDGYTDPPWDGTEKDFAETVLPARMDAVTEVLNENLADWVREAGLHFEYLPIVGFTLMRGEP